MCIVQLCPGQVNHIPLDANDWEWHSPGAPLIAPVTGE